ncbi:LOW QUALITY PROTEIN: G patch domain and ankyrin repeat-containing protein 1-like [Elysia marginata]|uniref:G patch domain and ankyrin repeat-containing protein 1-like n=1 Tax=Elysia marginata TaxID=1093978 RepID=A0AAV4HXK4_9GAST|nr:LOW QUALITY PROTEIN: G patch domain and ankyrin repeat-containing protein 1-like [Elysia marginata]
MAASDPVYRNLIQFVPEQPCCSHAEIVKEIEPTTISGQDAKSFYESVISSGVIPTPVASKTFTRSTSRSSSAVIVKQGAKCRGMNHSKNRKRTKNTREAIAVPPPSENIKKELSSKSEVRDSVSIEHLSKSRKDENKNSTPAAPSKKLTLSDRKHFSFLKAAQLGDSVEVSKLLDEGCDLNYKDFYGWTALMCAAREGHRRVVQCLLDCGADFQAVNNEGFNASYLASSAGHFELANIISSYAPSVAGASRDEEENILERFYCLTCKDYFLEHEKTAHLTSTVHLFNSDRKHQHPAYLLPETNRGFQMLLRTGWQVDKGLGPEGKGIKYPVKTVLKRDREGLGNSSCIKKAKITHFNPLDKKAVRAVTSYPKRNISEKVLKLH